MGVPASAKVSTKRIPLQKKTFFVVLFTPYHEPFFLFKDQVLLLKTGPGRLDRLTPALSTSHQQPDTSTPSMPSQPLSPVMLSLEHCDQSFWCLPGAFILIICIGSSLSVLLLLLMYEIYLLISGIAYFIMSPEDRVRMAAERRATGRGSRVVGNDDDEEVGEDREQRQECDLERQPLLVACEDRARDQGR
ncbi:hypothetical protein BDR22DRAFT_892472 [Usnea florida]